MTLTYSSESFEQKYTYSGDDLGAVYSREKTAFRVWAPTAQSVTLELYRSGNETHRDRFMTVPMAPGESGTWEALVGGDLNGVYYTYKVNTEGKSARACDPYARATGVNGKRAMVIDLSATNPLGWEEDINPHAGERITDAVIYELHLRDLSADASSGIVHTGKFLGLTETGTKTPGGMPTGLDHIKELGVTHIHLLPVYDFGSVDEAAPEKEQYNWGYDPVNFNVPEGSYATDPYHGEVRVKEMKCMIRALHENGLSVIMDVVYNHVQYAESFCFNRLVPGYFSRTDAHGHLSNGSGCGNDTASERSMVRKYIVDSVNYWADEYHIDGFRFDLVGLLDIDTVNEIVCTVHQKHPDVIFYGEGWTMGTAVTKQGVELATQWNSWKTPDFAYFSDTMRDALKGGTFHREPGYVAGGFDKTGTVFGCIQGRTDWSANPSQMINYASCHDNHTLFDRLELSRLDASREDLIRMNKLAAAIVFGSQGVPFFQAGEEMLRTKADRHGCLVENSYNAPDAVNSIKWMTLDNPQTAAVSAYYQGLIAFRKAHAGLRLSSHEEAQAHITAHSSPPPNVLAFHITCDEDAPLILIFNPTRENAEISLPEGNWGVYVNGEQAGTRLLDVACEKADVPPISAMMMVKRSESAVLRHEDRSAQPKL